LVFGAGALILLASAVLETWANAYSARLPKRLARILLALGVGQLLPLPGLMVLLAGEAILMLRLYLRDRESAAVSRPATGRPWGPAFRSAASKWGLALSMMVFAWTLQDRIAEAGAAISVVVWAILNLQRKRPRYRLRPAAVCSLRPPVKRNYDIRDTQDRQVNCIHSHVRGSAEGGTG